MGSWRDSAQDDTREYIRAHYVRKNFTRSKVFGVTMSNIYAIGCQTSKFDVTMSEAWQSALPTFFSKKRPKTPNTN